MIDAGFHAVFHINLDHIEPPRQVPRSKAFQPRVRASLDQALLGLVHGIQRADSGTFPAGFHLHE